MTVIGAVKLLMRCQEFVGLRTSLEEQQPQAEPEDYTPMTVGDELREEALKEDRRDTLVQDIRAYLNDFRDMNTDNLN